MADPTFTFWFIDEWGQVYHVVDSVQSGPTYSDASGQAFAWGTDIGGSEVLVGEDFVQDLDGPLVPFWPLPAGQTGQQIILPDGVQSITITQTGGYEAQEMTNGIGVFTAAANPNLVGNSPGNYWFEGLPGGNYTDRPSNDLVFVYNPDGTQYASDGGPPTMGDTGSFFDIGFPGPGARGSDFSTLGPMNSALSADCDIVRTEFSIEIQWKGAGAGQTTLIEWSSDGSHPFGLGDETDPDLAPTQVPWSAHDDDGFWTTGPVAAHTPWLSGSSGAFSGPGIAFDGTDVWVCGEWVHGDEDVRFCLARFSAAGELQELAVSETGSDTVTGENVFFQTADFQQGCQWAPGLGRLFVNGVSTTGDTMVGMFDPATGMISLNDSIGVLLGTEVQNIAWDETRGLLWAYPTSSTNIGGTYVVRAYGFDPTTLDWGGAGSATAVPTMTVDLIRDDSVGPYFSEVSTARVTPDGAYFLLDCWGPDDRLIIATPIDGGDQVVVLDLLAFSGHSGDDVYDLWFAAPPGGLLKSNIAPLGIAFWDGRTLDTDVDVPFSGRHKFLDDNGDEWVQVYDEAEAAARMATDSVGGSLTNFYFVDNNQDAHHVVDPHTGEDYSDSGTKEIWFGVDVSGSEVLTGQQGAGGSQGVGWLTDGSLAGLQVPWTPGDGSGFLFMGSDLVTYSGPPLIGPGIVFDGTYVWVGGEWYAQDTPVVTTYSDDFERADTVSGLGSTPVGSKAWTEAAASGTAAWGIASGKAYAVGSDAVNHWATIDTGFASGSVEALIENNDGGLIFRWTNSSNYFRVQLNASAPSISIVRVQSGSTTTLATSGSGASLGDVIKVTFTGNSIKVFRNGTQVLSITSSFNITATNCGMFTTHGAAGTPARFTYWTFTNTTLVAAPRYILGKFLPDGTLLSLAFPEQVSPVGSGSLFANGIADGQRGMAFAPTRRCIYLLSIYDGVTGNVTEYNIDTGAIRVARNAFTALGSNQDLAWDETRDLLWTVEKFSNNVGGTFKAFAFGYNPDTDFDWVGTTPMSASMSVPVINNDSTGPYYTGIYALGITPDGTAIVNDAYTDAVGRVIIATEIDGGAQSIVAYLSDFGGSTTKVLDIWFPPLGRPARGTMKARLDDGTVVPVGVFVRVAP